MKPRVDQALAGMHAGDAISDDAIAIRDLLRRSGFESDIFCDPDHLGVEMRGEARDFRIHHPAPHDILIFHFAIAGPLPEWYAELPCRRVMRYHNITPAEHFVGFNDRVATQLAQGRRLLPRLAPMTEMALCDSAFNADELRAAGYAHAEVVPIVIDFERFDEAPDPVRLAALRGDDRPNILFVGRVVPNKRQEDLVKVQAVRKHALRAPSVTWMVGSYGGAQRYVDHLLAMIRTLDVVDCAHFTGMVPHRELLAHFHAADLFLCLSEHEGFCVPLVEAMHHGVPIIAHAAGAVPETLGEGGVLVEEKHLPAIAELIDVVLGDDGMRERMREAQRERLAAFQPEAVRLRFLEVLGDLLA